MKGELHWAPVEQPKHVLDVVRFNLLLLFAHATFEDSMSYQLDCQETLESKSTDTSFLQRVPVLVFGLSSLLESTLRHM